ncbi:hypothetical protein CHLRE_09g411500v5 [Chlamydomonas reinhardtii]|uniref:Inosine/uridine-preferring nucleoside hydrolase domain-containing protein n=1 Tax=Chlamydomonas reinhardtii TaxID=3055 RepID=A0A2K3DFN8_CHLRE|nr:uncharacterized protein CHLRE_09g411500v5 [Chlamydomonas reinhardtii]PNW79335.1 hypothetical protein CHLRE_09g411500v5 [Chlamydomonas reinhardtii]
MASAAVGMPSRLPTAAAAFLLAVTCLLLLGVASADTASPSDASDIKARPNRPRKVIFDHDGGIDDYVTLLLLLSCPERVRVIGITILDADCRAELAWNTTLKLLHTLGHEHVPVAVSSLPAVNPFPDPWRNSVLSVDVLPHINDLTQEDLAPLRLSVPGQELMAQLLLGTFQSASGSRDKSGSRSNGTDGGAAAVADDDDDGEPITVVATGPLSNVAHVLRKHGRAAADRIREVWWMGGAVWVGGNVAFPGHDGSAEWNAFWDPAAVGEVWGWPSVPLVVVPLDATNAVPVTPDLIYRFGRQSRYRYSVLAGTVWSRVVTWVYDRPDEPYYAWDTLTAACVLQPDLCDKLYDVQSYVVVAGASQGRTVPLAPSPEAAAAAAGGGEKGSCVAAAPDVETGMAGRTGVKDGEEGVQSAVEAARMLAEVTGAGAAEATTGGQRPGQQQGEQQQRSGSRGVTVVRHVDAEDFYTFVLNALRL